MSIKAHRGELEVRQEEKGQQTVTLAHPNSESGIRLTPQYPMDNSASNYSNPVKVYASSGDDILELVTREKARELKAAGTHFFINAGKDLRRITPLDPVTLVQESMGWNMPFGRMRSSAFNEGRVGQFSIGYEIPYAFKGHLKSPHAWEVNQFDTKPA